MDFNTRTCQQQRTRPEDRHLNFYARRDNLIAAGRPKLLELGAVLAFVGFTVTALTVDPSATRVG
jgi:hypothetical protein